MTETTVMNMMTAALLTKAITAIITTITRVAPQPPVTLATPVAAPLRIPRQAQRRSEIFRSIGLIPPQYMPALARTHILRLRMLKAATACPRRPPGNRTQEQRFP
jgi:hypothetical protein